MIFVKQVMIWTQSWFWTRIANLSMFTSYSADTSFMVTDIAYLKCDISFSMFVSWEKFFHISCGDTYFFNPVFKKNFNHSLSKPFIRSRYINDAGIKNFSQHFVWRICCLTYFIYILFIYFGAVVNLFDFLFNMYKD